MTPRPRSRDKVVPVSIGIPSSLMMRLENTLDFHHSRSKWVSDAIERKFEQRAAIDGFTMFELLQQLYHLNLFSLSELSKYSVRAKSLTEETGEEQ